MFKLIYLSSESPSVYDSSIEAQIDSSYSTLHKFYTNSYSSALHSFSTKFPSSNCEKVIISPVCSWYDVGYGIYETPGRIVSASIYRRDVYVNVIENVC